MTTIKFIKSGHKGQMTVENSKKNEVINSLLAVGYAIVNIK